MILTLLAIRPRTGYELAQLCKAPVSLVWAASMSQIYPELARLTEAGFASFETSAGQGPLDKKTYTISDAGRAALRRQLLGARPEETIRNALVIWAQSSWLLEPAQGAAIWRRETARLGAEAEALRRLWDETRARNGWPSRSAPGEPSFGPWAAIEFSVRRKEAETGFARRMAAMCRASEAEIAAVERTLGKAGDAPPELTVMQQMLLSRLALWPRSGYDLALFAKPPLNLLWTVSLSQIYPDLAKLADRELVSYELGRTRRPLDKKTYSVTEAGCEALRRLLLQPRSEEATRSTLALRALGSWTLAAEEAAELWRGEAAQLRRDIAALGQRWTEVKARHDYPAEPVPDNGGFGAWAVFELTIGRKEAEAELADELAQSYDAATGEIGAVA